MLRKRIILISSAAVFIAVYSFALLKLGIYMGSARSGQTYETTQTTQYIVKEYNNMIAVFENGSDVPQRVLEIDVETLRKQDRERFQQGIIVNSDAELAQLEEDFCS